MAKNNQKKEKAERNKEYANKFKKRTGYSKFGNRRSGNKSSNPGSSPNTAAS